MPRAWVPGEGALQAGWLCSPVLTPRTPGGIWGLQALRFPLAKPLTVTLVPKARRPAACSALRLYLEINLRRSEAGQRHELICYIWWG